MVSIVSMVSMVRLTLKYLRSSKGYGILSDAKNYLLS